MNRAEKGVLIGTAALVVLIVVLEAISPKPTNWRESFTRYATDPYATGLVYDRLEDLFHEGVTTVREPIYGTAQERLKLDSTATHVNHIFIASSFDADELDVEHLLMMVDRGDNAFIAVDHFCQPLRDTLAFGYSYRWDAGDTIKDIHGITDLVKDKVDTLRFTTWPQRGHGAFAFKHGGMDRYFDRLPLDHAQVLAINANDDVVLWRIRHGAGWIYLCSVPLAFTDYYLLKDEGRGFMETALSFLPDKAVLWDEYSKVGREGSNSPLRFILADPALKAAYWTVIVLLLLFVLVHAKRRQRAIPEIAPLRNTSRDFAETIGRLYYFKGDHADLASKMAGQFKEEVRRKLHLRRSQWDEETLQDIHARTGISMEELQHATRLMAHFETTEHASQEQLLQFNKTLTSLRNRL